jgi:hypothetical protein
VRARRRAALELGLLLGLVVRVLGGPRERVRAEEAIGDQVEERLGRAGVDVLLEGAAA